MMSQNVIIIVVAKKIAMLFSFMYNFFLHTHTQIIPIILTFSSISSLTTKILTNIN